MNGSKEDRTERLDRTGELYAGRKRDSMLTRGLAILSAFRTDDVEVTLAELARRAGLPKPTAHRLVAELLDSGFLERGQRGLVLGRQVFVLGGRLQRDQKIRVLAHPQLQKLRRSAGVSMVCLSVARGRDVIHLLRVGRSRVADEREEIVDLGSRRVLAQISKPGPATGPVVRLEDAVRASAVLACPIRLPGAAEALALSVLSVAGQQDRSALARELQHTAQELATRIATLPDSRAVTIASTADVSGAA
ncbi:helix-turn-helix domain-containing protein [Streptomyces sp. NPDC101181]|uniref:helix-turn-helix domain-containing protein n=1 Tax=Streptomyces sp. NPDC101181 TaxID=3366125 RepID=UPI0038149D23